MLVDTVMDARAALHTPLHVLTVMAALGPLVIRPLYAARGWWDVKRERWLADLAGRDVGLAHDLHTVLTACDDPARQAAFEALAMRVAGDLAYRDGRSDSQSVP